jgi:phosphoribosylformylglycinamidine synthase I
LKPVGVLRFLGTNCDADVLWALDSLKVPNRYIWWADRFDVNEYSSYVLPGGFSYGDYLRAGALAARAPAIEDLKMAVKKGSKVLGICNGFQILCEAGLLPGVLIKNISQKFQDEWVDVFEPRRSEHRFNLPIAHSMGRFFADKKTLNEIEASDQVWLRYSSNPNGSLNDIAGVSDHAKNVFALMPHPERAMHKWMGSNDGVKVLEVLDL